MRLLTKVFIIINFIILSSLFVIYAPTFKRMQKKFVSEIAINKKISYLSYTFYSEEKIESMKDEKIDLVKIKEDSLDNYYTESKEAITYDSKYDEIVLSKDVGVISNFD